jgi:hypothetical protein
MTSFKIIVLTSDLRLVDKWKYGKSHWNIYRKSQETIGIREFAHAEFLRNTCYFSN